MKKILFSALLSLVVFSLFATPWEEVPSPLVTGVSAGKDDPRRLFVYFEFETEKDSGEKAVVELYDDDMDLVDSKSVGKSRKLEKKAYFQPSSSGLYHVSVRGIRGEEEKKSELYSFYWSYPLFQPVIQARNIGSSSILVEWESVLEAEEYIVSFDGEEFKTTDTSMVFPSLPDGIKHEIVVSARRGEEVSSSSPLTKTSRKDEDRAWYFTRFGQSTKESLNKCTILDSDDLTLSLSSCLPAQDGSTSEKGGKFTSLHDGISYYYTVIDSKKENFSLTATFTLDYINPTPDGQEGFGIVAMDSLGEDGVSSRNHYTNSVSLIATKFEGWINGTKYSSKDTLGSRFVTGMTEEVLKGGDEKIAENARSVSQAYSFDKDDLVKSGEKYTLTLILDNTGFRAVLNGEEHILYKGREELTVLDRDHIYVGFAAARGCNVTVSDVSFSVSDPEKDPVGEEAPPEMVPYLVKFESPSTSSSLLYNFSVSSVSDGVAYIREKESRKALTAPFPVEGGTIVSGFIPLKAGTNSVELVFSPDKDYVPGENQVMAKWNEKGKLEESYSDIIVSYAIEQRSLGTSVIYVSPEGRSDGDGSAESPLSLQAAIAFSSPGDTIVMREGTYFIDERVKIERGNSGTRMKRKTLIGEGKVVLDFSKAKYGMELWGDWWLLSSFTLTNTPDGKKGLQIAGSNNIVRNVEASFCGDTGIQISGSGSESWSRWPKNNRVEYCVSHDNADKAMNNADGFAAKLTVAEGNVFYSCVAYNNADDGWDLFSKIETGPIGSVIIENSVAYSNGILSDGRSGGDGNGFKLGGDGIAVAHVLKDSVAFKNLSNGVTSNSNPAVKVEGVVSWNNWGANITLYGKGSGDRNFSLERTVSLSGGSMDNISEMPSLLSPDTYLWDGEKSRNSLGAVIGEDIFLSLDFKGLRMDGGTLSLSSFLEVQGLEFPTGLR